jgi:hypothetical protein
MEKEPDMNWYTLLVGMTGGVLVAAVLEYPLHTCLPNGWVEGWSTASVWLALLLVLAAALLLAACGAVAGRLGVASNRRRAAAVGALAGMTAAFVAEAWIGGVAAGVWGSRAILSHGLHPAQDDTQFLRLLFDASVDSMWWIYLSVWIAAAAGLGFGGLGGALAGKGRGAGGLDPRVPVPVALIGLLVSSAAVPLTILVFSTLGPALVQVAAEEGFNPVYPKWIIQYFPVASSYLFMIAWQCISVIVLRRAPADTSSDRAARDVAAWMFAAIPFITVILSMLFLGPAFFTIPVIAGALLSILIGILAIPAGRSHQEPVQPPVPAAAPGFHFLGSVFILGFCVVLITGNLGVVPYSLGVSKLDIDMIPTLLPRSDQTAAQSATPRVQSISIQVDENYSLNRLALAHILAAAGVLAALIAAATWLILRRTGPQEPATRKAGIVRGLACLLVSAALLFLTLFGVFLLPVFRLSTIMGA